MMTVLAFVVAIALLVVFHELGHYLVARACDVKVLRFSVGFGKVLYARQIGETEWALSAIPLGGYVKMLDEREGEVIAAELPRAFNRKPVWQRMAIVVAGPLANLLLAVVLYFALLLHGVPGLKPVLGEVPPDTPAAASGLVSGMTVLAIAEQPTPSWQDIRWALLEHVLQGGQVMLDLRTEDGITERRALSLAGVTAADLDGDFMGKLGLQPYQPPVYPVIGKLVAGGAAERAGLQTGDRILNADGQPLARWQDWVEVVRAHPAQPLRIEVERNGVLLVLSVTPDAVTDGNQTIGRIGAGAQIDQAAFDAMLTEVRYSPLTALPEAVRRTWDTAVLSLRMMGKMVLGEVSLKNLSGPITIADYAGQSAAVGAVAYLGFLALISISLGVLNLLPIPLLDGGHLLYYAIELFKGSPVSESAWEAGQKVGITLLVTLMAFALYNDISRLLAG